MQFEVLQELKTGLVGVGTLDDRMELIPHPGRRETKRVTPVSIVESRQFIHRVVAMAGNCARASLYTQTKKVKMSAVGALQIVCRLVSALAFSEVTKMQPQVRYLPTGNPDSTVRIKRALQ